MLNYRALDSVSRALADPTRRAIIERLSDGDASVSDLAEPLPISLAAVVRSCGSAVRRAPEPRLLKGYQVHLRGAHEVVFRQSADGVGAEGDAAVVVADLEVRVVILDVGDMRQRVHEAHGAVEVPETELAPDGERVFSQYPGAGELRAQLLCLGMRQRRGSAFAGLAFACGEFVHASPRRA